MVFASCSTGFRTRFFEGIFLEIDLTKKDISLFGELLCVDNESESIRSDEGTHLDC